MTRIVGILRFSVLTEGSKSYKATKGKSLDEALATLFDADRLDRRCLLVRTMPLASLDAQTDKEFELVIRISALLPDAYKEQVYRLAEQRGYARIVEYGVDGTPTSADPHPITDEPVITFRIDDDDALNPYYIADLRSMATHDNLGKVISFPNGVYAQARQDPNRLKIGNVYYKNNAFGLAYFGTDGRTIFQLGGHSRIDRHPMVLHDRPRAWIRSIHQGSDSGAGLKEDARYKVVRLRDIEEELPEYRHLDFPALVRGLRYERQVAAPDPAAAP